MNGETPNDGGRHGLSALSQEQVEAIDVARARKQRRAERRELLAETATGAGFAGAALVMWLALPHAGLHVWLALWLGLVCALLVRVEFEVGEGCTRPVELAFVPMLLLLPPAAVPLVVAGAHMLARLPDVAVRRVPAQRTLMGLGDAWFAIAPALTMAALGPRGSTASAGVAVAAAVAVQIGSDFAISALRIWAGVGVGPREQLRAYAWVYLVDVVLAPIGLLAALVGRDQQLAVGAVVPLAGLLAVFARERRERIENALALQRVAQEGRDRLESIVHNASDVILILDADGAVQTLTGSVSPVFGDDWESARGEPLVERVHPDDAAPVAAFLGAVALKATGESQEAEWRLRYADGAHRHMAAVATNLLDDPRVEGIVLTLRDVDARKALEEQLRHRAFHDPLTGLANRALFYDRLEHALTRGSREDTEVAVLFIDLDDFKTINDSLGHATGDTVLEEVALRLTGCLRSADTAARLGGDEFGVLLESLSGPAAAQDTAARVLASVGQPLTVGDQAIALSVSVGVAISAPNERGVDELLRRGDLAMYAAKGSGKARVESYHASLEEIEAPSPERGKWFRGNDDQREEILSVLEDPDALTMVFQPIIDLRTGRVAGYESLARFQREPRRPPNVWFTQAHRCGLGYTLEAKALTLALAATGRPAGTYLTVNLSPSSLVSPEVQRALPERLDDLVIEVTENELVSEDPAIAQAIADLRKRGARLAVDDVGAGYAGLTHVMRLAPDIIKLDRALTTGVDHERIKASLIGSFVRYAREIDATVCAEGVETMAELACLADLDVGYGQGYAIARPAAPWAHVAAEAAAQCLTAFAATLSDADVAAAWTDHDRRLEYISGRLAHAATPDELRAQLTLVAAELGADHIELTTDSTGADLASIGQLLASDDTRPEPHRREMLASGYRSRLTVPLRAQGDPIGVLSLYAHEERPWSRFAIHRARIIAHQLAAILAEPGRASVGV
jgi:diguanylate cyclase (GGDEF)-like protein/PAS domain S-box-containing protein